MGKLKDILFSWKVLVLILFLLGSVVAIGPKFNPQGVVVTSVATNSSADFNGIVTGLRISSINDQPVGDVSEFRTIVSNLTPNETVKISTNKGEFNFLAEIIDNTTSLGFDVGKIPTSNIKQGLDLVGGVRVLLKPDVQMTAQQLSDVIAITQKRLNTFGLQDISVDLFLISRATHTYW